MIQRAGRIPLTIIFRVRVYTIARSFTVRY
jgi:hypothetical protein